MKTITRRNVLKGGTALAGGMAGILATGRAPAFAQTQPKKLVFAHIHGYLSMATSLLWLRQPDTFGVIGLALNACEERGGQVSHGQALPRRQRKRKRLRGRPQTDRC